MKVYVGEGAELLKFAMGFFRPKSYLEGSYVADYVGGGYDVQAKNLPDRFRGGLQVIKREKESFIFKKFPEVKTKDDNLSPEPSDVFELAVFITLTPYFSIENSGGRDEDGFLVIVEDSEEFDKKIKEACWLETIPEDALERWAQDAVYKKLLLDFDLKLDRSFDKFKAEVKRLKH